MPIRAQRILLRSAARTVATACPQQTDPTALGVRLFLNVTAASGTGGLTLQLRAYERVSGATAILMLAAAAITATGIYVYELLEGSVSAAEGDVKHSVSRPLPMVWDVNLAVGDASSYTYSLSAETTG